MGTTVLKSIGPSSLDRRTARTSTDVKRISVLSSDCKRKISLNKPTPLDFDNFIPWVCTEWQIPDKVMVIRMNQEKVPRTEKRSSKSTSRSIRLKEDDESTTSKKGIPATNTIATRSSQVIENIITITAYYDSRGRLAEISIILCFTPLHRKIIQAISICIPFHSILTKLVIRKGCLDQISLYEISKLLPHSNLTDICLDDSYVPEGNYYVLLDQASSIKYLSLNRCGINDEVCKEIAMRIVFGRPAETSLLVLDLGSNKITDLGAKYFGDALRSNRHLLHLCLFGNKISDIGLGFLIRPLKEFSLTDDEILERKQRKFEYFRRKNEVYECSLAELILEEKSDNLSYVQSDKQTSSPSKLTKIKKQKTPVKASRSDIAEKMTLEVLGQFTDPFDDLNVCKRDMCIGNMKLCSLNVAYNNIEFPSLLKIIEVLSYQSRFEKNSHNTGLLRIVLEGNYLPNKCPELDRIDVYLKMKMASDLHMPVKQQLLKKRPSR